MKLILLSKAYNNNNNNNNNNKINNESLGWDETGCVRLAVNVLSQITGNFIVNFYLWICVVGNTYVI